MKIGPDTAKHLADSFRASAKSRAAFCKTWGVTLGVSAGTVGRVLAKQGIKSGRKKREQKSSITDADIQILHNLKFSTRRKNNQVMLDMVEAVQIAKVNRLILDGKSISSYNRRGREMGLTTKAIRAEKAWRPIVTDHPNHMHQADATPCVLYFLSSDGKIKAANDPVLEVSHKPQDFKNVKKHLIRYLVVDHASGSVFFQYRYDEGETAKAVIDTLFEAWRLKSDERFPFHGVPRFLFCDPGSAYKNQFIKNLCSHLGVELLHHSPGNPRAKGCAEATNNWMTKKFEGRLALKQPRTVEELNRWALEFCVAYNAERDFRDTGHSRSQLWRFITQEELRLCPDEATFKRCAATEPIRRVVRANLQINFDGKIYRLPSEPRFAGEEVFIRINAYDEGKVEAILFKDTDHEERFMLAPIEFNKFGLPNIKEAQRPGEPKAMKDSRVIQANKKAEDDLKKYGVTFKGQNSHRRAIAPLSGDPRALDAFNFELENLSDVKHLPKKGTELPMNVAAKAEPKYKMLDAIAMIRNELGRKIYTSENRYIRAAFPAGLTQKNIDEVITKFVADDESGSVVEFKTG